MKKVYIALSVDTIHHGHINLINQAKKYGYLIVGLLTDKAIAEKKRLPLLNWKERKKILENIEGINEIIPQNEWDYSFNLKKIKPDIMLHGDDWKFNEEKKHREKTIKTLKKLGSKLIEIPHTKGISSSAIRERIYLDNNSPEYRRSILKRLLITKEFCRFIEAHSPLSAIIAEKIFYKGNKEKKEFDGFWSSSLTDSTLKGKPDIEIIEINQRLNNINEIFDVTTKPLIIDVDTGGKPEHFEINIKTIERMGISALIVEDKKGLKKNSLFGTKVKQEQEDIKSFCKKISVGKNACSSNDFMIISRIESLIMNKGVNDAINRAQNYIDAGSDGIMIHDKKSSPKDVFKFSKIFKKKYPNIPLVVVPSSFNKVNEYQLIDHGFNIVIYANHLLRASYPAMLNTARNILKYSRSYEKQENLMSIKEILNLIPGTK